MTFIVSGTFFDEIDKRYEAHTYVVVARNTIEAAEDVIEWWGEDNVMDLNIHYCNEDSLVEIDPITNELMIEDSPHINKED